MKCFLLLVQEGKVRIPAPVWEVVARAATAPPPPPPRLSVVLRGRCFAPKLLSDMSCSLVLISFNLWHDKFHLHCWQQLLPCYLLAFRKARTESCSPKKNELASMKVNPDISIHVLFKGCFDHIHDTSALEPVTTPLVP